MSNLWKSYLNILNIIIHPQPNISKRKTNRKYLITYLVQNTDYWQSHLYRVADNVVAVSHKPGFCVTDNKTLITRILALREAITHKTLEFLKIDSWLVTVTSSNQNFMTNWSCLPVDGGWLRCVRRDFSKTYHFTSSWGFFWSIQREVIKSTIKSGIFPWPRVWPPFVVWTTSSILLNLAKVVCCRSRDHLVPGAQAAHRPASRPQTLQVTTTVQRWPRWRSHTPLQRSNWCILEPQPIGLGDLEAIEYIFIAITHRSTDPKCGTCYGPIDGSNRSM